MNNQPSSGQERSEKTFAVLHRIFLVGILLKAINSVAEIVGGWALLAISTKTIQEWISGFFKPILQKDPSQSWAQWCLDYSSKLDTGTQSFVAWYFLSHGVIKAFVVVCLFYGWMWAYPMGVAVFVGFMLYQTYEYFWGSHSWFYIFLDVFDAFLIWLTFNEWKHAEKMRDLQKSIRPSAEVLEAETE